MTLVEQLTAHLRQDGGWISGAQLERITWKKKNGVFYKASNISRRLRELAEEGTLEARGNPVEYRYAGPKKYKTLYDTIIRDGRPVAVPRLVEV